MIKINREKIRNRILALGRYFRNFASGVRTLRWKLFLSYFFIGITPMLILWGTIANILEEHILEQRVSELRFHTTQTARNLSSADYINEPIGRHLQNPILDSLAESQQAWIIVVDDMATVLYDSLAVAQGSTRATPGIIQALGGTHHTAVTTDDITTITEIAPILDGGAVVGAISMTHDVTAELAAVINDVNSNTRNFIIILGVVVVVVVMATAQMIMRPMRRILTSTQKISQGHLDERIKLIGKDEFYDLGLAINDMTHKLAQVETARQEFVSNVSHELKTPLSSIKVLSESLIHQGDVENEMHLEFLTDITSEVDRMTNIVNELLALVRLDEAELPLKISSFSLNHLLEAMVKRLRPLAEQRSVTIEFTELKQVDIEADEMKISLALSNLTENAIKYNNPEGNVNIQLDADNKSAFVTISDTGVGISEENQAKVFTRFFRVEKARGRETGGTGLGLSITHKTILLHKGSIKLTSKEEEGSTFVVRLPLHNMSSRARPGI